MSGQGSAAESKLTASKGPNPQGKDVLSRKSPGLPGKWDSYFPCLSSFPVPRAGPKGLQSPREATAATLESWGSGPTPGCLQMSHAIWPRKPPWVNFPGSSNFSLLCYYLFTCLCLPPAYEPLRVQASCSAFISVSPTFTHLSNMGPCLG